MVIEGLLRREPRHGPVDDRIGRAGHSLIPPGAEPPEILAEAGLAVPGAVEKSETLVPVEPVDPRDGGYGVIPQLAATAIIQFGQQAGDVVTRTLGERDTL